MRRYADDDEERMHLQRSVKAWGRSGLLRADQSSHLQAELQVDLRRTGIMLRLGLALFTTILASATFLLAWMSLGVSNETATGVLALLTGGFFFWAADALVARFRLYRYGVEEALLVASVGLFGVGIAMIGNSTFHLHDSTAMSVSLAAAAAASGYAYHRFGLQYAGVAAIMCVALIPILFDEGSEPVRRSLAALIFLAAALVTGAMAARASHEVRRDDGFMLRAAAVVGLYLVVNLEIAAGPFDRYGRMPDTWFRWTTYVLIWIIPVLALWRGVASRDRKLMLVGLGLALTTLITNKSYLGLPRQTWDPMLFGLLLMAVAVVVRRWLASGPGGARRGFTGERILHTDADALRLVSLASAAIHLDTDRPGPAPTPSSPQFGGGRSGGAGAGGEF